MFDGHPMAQKGPVGKFAIFFLAFCSFVGTRKVPATKMLAAMMFGYALTAVELDGMTDSLRLTFGFTELLNGFNVLMAVIWLFGIREILLTMEEGFSFTGRAAKMNARVAWETWKTLPRYWKTH